MSICVERKHRKIIAVSEYFYNALNSCPGTYKPQNPLTRTVRYFENTVTNVKKSAVHQTLEANYFLSSIFGK